MLLPTGARIEFGSMMDPADHRRYRHEDPCMGRVQPEAAASARRDAASAGSMAGGELVTLAQAAGVTVDDVPGGGGDQTPVYHLHIPHSAGTTVNQLLEARFRPSELFTGGLLPALLDTPTHELRKFRLFRGHFGLVLPTRLDWRVRCLTVLRDPVEQALSLFGFIRRSPSHYFHERVNAPGYGIADFLRDPACRPLIQHQAARFLAFEPTPQDWAWPPPLDPLDPRARQASFELCPMGLTDAALFDRAAATLRQVSVAGITERLPETLMLISHALGWPPLGPHGHLNAAPARLRADDLSPTDLARLRALKELDLELYNLAARQFAARIDQVPGRATGCDGNRQR